jgi:hypothetical protein
VAPDAPPKALAPDDPQRARMGEVLRHLRLRGLAA